MNIAVDGINTSYVDVGEGKIVVLLHGWGSNKENLQDLQNSLAEKFRVIALDLPGFGDSALPPLDWTVGDYAGFTARFLEAIDATHLYAVVGHSFGGRICIKGIGSGILQSDRMVLIGSAGIKHSATFKNRIVVGVAKLGKGVLSLPLLRKYYSGARNKLHQQVGSGDYANSGDLQQIFLNTIHEDLQDSASRITIPSLLLWGSEDMESPISDARRFQHLIKDSKLKIVQGAGHFVHNDRPEKISKWINEFLS